MLKYNPERAPNSTAWLAADEHERIEAVKSWHRKARVELPNDDLHASFHVIVENQLAENLDSVVRAISRMMKEGLSRHDALHAVAAVLSRHLFDMMTDNPADGNARNELYYAQLDCLTAKSWLEMADE